MTKSELKAYKKQYKEEYGWDITEKGISTALSLLDLGAKPQNKMLDCTVCKGVGWYECRNHKGNNCSNCGGSSTHRCWYCKGTKKTEQPCLIYEGETYSIQEILEYIDR